MKKNTRTDKGKSSGMRVIPYVEGVTVRLSRVFKKHWFSTGIKPHRTFRNMLVHLKDKRDPPQSTAEAIYGYRARIALNLILWKLTTYLEPDFQNIKQQLKNTCGKNYTISQKSVYF